MGRSLPQEWIDGTLPSHVRPAFCCDRRCRPGTRSVVSGLGGRRCVDQQLWATGPADPGRRPVGAAQPLRTALSRTRCSLRPTATTGVLRRRRHLPLQLLVVTTQKQRKRQEINKANGKIVEIQSKEKSRSQRRPMPMNQ